MTELSNVWNLDRLSFSGWATLPIPCKSMLWAPIFYRDQTLRGWRWVAIDELGVDYVLSASRTSQ